MRMLTYGICADATDEYCRLSETSAILSFKMFCRSIVQIFAKTYLRLPTMHDIAKQLILNEKRGNKLYYSLGRNQNYQMSVISVSKK